MPSMASCPPFRFILHVEFDFRLSTLSGKVSAYCDFAEMDALKTQKEAWIHDVFLSFRGEDTRKNFTDHLYFALTESGINAYRDDNELRRGENITSELQRAIQGARIAVIVFSKNYADSRWCLEELVKIMECRRTVRQLVLPIFYDVDPSDVRKQAGSFAEAFARHEERFFEDIDKVLKWRFALTEAANLSGWDLRNTADGHEARFIRSIVEEISRELNSTYLFVALYPVGIDPRLKEVTSLLDAGSENVRMLGIWGMGGMGKTTIAKAAYNQYYHSFEGKCFLANIKEVSKLPKGQVRLQEQLLSDILKTKDIKLGSVDRGIIVIKERLCRRRVLVILDDVDQIEQLNNIAGSRNWFGSGSQIIITTRDEHLLKQLQVDEVYNVDEMDDVEALELFSWHAFRNSYPAEGYLKLSRDVVSYCAGLPLALEVLGCFLFGRSMVEWSDTLEKLKTIPNDQIQKKLRISYDGLNDRSEQNLFLDIACFFIGMDKNYVAHILDGCGLFPEIGISVLLQRCLLTIGQKNKLLMHDLVRDMGREIIREKSPKEPGKHSRLWHSDEVLNVLTKMKGTDAIEGLSLKLPTSNEENLQTEAFTDMQNLRLLQLNYVNLKGDFEHLSKSLRWLCWHGFPLTFIPSNFHMGDIVALDLRCSNLRQVWKDGMLLKKLKILNIGYSPYLTKTPDFSKLPHLEKLVLKGCKSLIEIHPSIGVLNKLGFVNLKDCIRLKELPRTFFKLKCLQTLIISGCSRIDNLPEDVGEMESLITLIADNTAIHRVPSTIARLKNLTYLSLSGCKGLPDKSLPSIIQSWISPRNFPKSILLPASLQGLTSLKKLYLANCNLSSDAIPKDLGNLSSLEELDLKSNNFHSLPSSLQGLSKLHTLLLDNCSKLLSIPDLPPCLSALEARNCVALERISNLSEIKNMVSLSVTNCSKLVDIPGLDKIVKSNVFIHMEGCDKITSSARDTILQGWAKVRDYGSICLPGQHIPIWYTYKDEGDSICFEVPQIIDFCVKGFLVGVVYTSLLDNVVSEEFSSLTVVNYTKGAVKTRNHFAIDVVMTVEDHIWQSYLSNKQFSLEGGDEVEVIVDFGSKITVKKVGICLLFESLVDGTVVQLPSGTNDEGGCELEADLGKQRDLEDDHEDCEAGSSRSWSAEEPPPKRLKYEPESEV